MEAETKNVNIHVLFNDADLPYLSPYINVLQNLKLKMKPEYDYTSQQLAYPPTEKTDIWLQPRTFQPGSTISNNPFLPSGKTNKRNNHRFTVLAGLSNKSPVMITKAVSATMYLSF